jgi:hypothetical protein
LSEAWAEKGTVARNEPPGWRLNMAFISITRLRVRSWRFLPGFFWQAMRSGRQAKATPGNLGVTVLREPGNVYWTRTAWESEGAMREFMVAGAHGRAMRSLLEWCDEAAVAHWTQENAEMPSWKVAHEKLVGIGRLSKVKHPSEAQRNFYIPEPRLESGREVRL